MANKIGGPSGPPPAVGNSPGNGADDKKLSPRDAATAFKSSTLGELAKSGKLATGGGQNAPSHKGGKNDALENFRDRLKTEVGISTAQPSTKATHQGLAAMLSQWKSNDDG